MRITKERVQQLALTDYFSRPNSPACTAILPYVEPHYAGVEIGVFMGTSSVCFLEHCQFMHFIDPCCEYPGNPDRGYYTLAAGFLDKVNQVGRGRFTFLQMMSEEAAPQIPSVDFVFIDGNHRYEYVKQDIELYWPKVKSGGFLSGHDYNQASVTRAVHEFHSSLPLEIHQNCWLVRKP